MTKRPTVLVAESLAAEGIAILLDGGADVREAIGASRDELSKAMSDADALLVRSRTPVDAVLLESAPALRVIGRAGVGVDGIDVEAATRGGIVVLNTPDASTTAAAEHAFALLLALCRQVVVANARVRDGDWSSKGLVGLELAGKTLGIIGLGRIGSAVATRAKAFDMRVLAHDAFVSEARAAAHGVELVTLDEVLAQSDIITLHAPASSQTRKMLATEQFARMKRGALLINCARGSLIDEAALLEALEAGRLAGAAVDVVEIEPPPRGHLAWRLLRHPRVLATPHIGASTRESQARIAADLCRDVLAVLRGQPPSAAVNAPVTAVPEFRPFVQLAYALGRAYPQIAEEPKLPQFVLTLEGELGDDARPFVAGFLIGLLQQVTDRRVSPVNAEAIAREMGIAVEPMRADCNRGFARAISVRGGHACVTGTVIHGAQQRLIDVDGYETDVAPQGSIILTRHRDVPGIVGKVGTILGDARINIASMQVAMRPNDGEALMLLAVDRQPDPEVMTELARIDEVRIARSIQL